MKSARAALGRLSMFGTIFCYEFSQVESSSSLPCAWTGLDRTSISVPLGLNLKLGFGLRKAPGVFFPISVLLFLPPEFNLTATIPHPPIPFTSVTFDSN